MASICFACSNDLVVEDEIVCGGFCKSTFHIGCVHLCAETRTLIQTNSQLFWMCLSCTKMMQNANFRQAIASTNEAMLHLEVQQNKVLEELRTEIKQNTAKINSILSLTPRTPKRVGEFSFSSQLAKRNRIDGSNSEKPQTIRKEQIGSKEDDQSFVVPLARREQKCWLYLSQFDPSATTDDISQLVKRNLETESEVQAVKLIPKGRKLEELSFVSFKVGVQMDLREKALLATSWQKGIYFREFEFARSTRPEVFRFEP